MRIGVTFPQTEITRDPIAVRAYAQAAEGLGYTHILTFEHVVGADTSVRPGWRGLYTVDSLFHEPFVLFGYLAGLTQRIEFVTGILILPQRQTILVAKQAAEVDVLSNGRLRLGVGLGWNEVEYQALRENFHDRGRRVEEQIEVLRKLFTEASVTYHGRWHDIEAAGINPLPIRRPVPIWLGGHTEATIRRTARIGDGWFPQMGPEEAAPMIRRLHRYAREAGRNPTDLGIESRITIGNTGPEEWRGLLEAWQEVGATHVAVNTMRSGLSSPGQHIEAITRFMEVAAPFNTPHAPAGAE